MALVVACTQAVPGSKKSTTSVRFGDINTPAGDGGVIIHWQYPKNAALGVALRRKMNGNAQHGRPERISRVRLNATQRSIYVQYIDH